MIEKKPLSRKYHAANCSVVIEVIVSPQGHISLREMRCRRLCDRCSGNSRHRQSSIVSRTMLGDHRGVFGEVECHGAVEPQRPGDHSTHSTSKGICGNPGFVGLGQTTAGGHHGSFDPRAPGRWDSVGVENGQRHLKTVADATRGRPGRVHCSGRRQRQRALLGRLSTCMVRCPIDVDGAVPGLIRRHFLEGRLGPITRSPGQRDRSELCPSGRLYTRRDGAGASLPQLSPRRPHCPPKLVSAFLCADLAFALILQLNVPNRHHSRLTRRANRLMFRFLF